MQLLMLKDRYINGESLSNPYNVEHDRHRGQLQIDDRVADQCNIQHMVQVFFADAGPRRKYSVCGRHGVRYADGSDRGYRCDEGDDFDADWPDDKPLKGLVSRFDICTDYASSLYIEQPDRHPGVGGWDGGLYIVRKRSHREYDGDHGEFGPDDTE